VLLYGLDLGEMYIRNTIANISEAEYDWEPIPPFERPADILLAPESKRVWRVFQQGDKWTYDYSLEELIPPPFTTIAWIMNHVAQTTEMYLYCTKSGKPEGEEKRWDDLPVQSNLASMKSYICDVLADARRYLVSIPKGSVNSELNRLAPAPWGEIRPAFMNIWGGIVEHVLQHDMQIAARKDRIRYGH
jgi:hypothetical protein